MKTAATLLGAVAVLANGADVVKHPSTHQYVKEAFMKSRTERADDFVLPLDERPPSYRGGKIECGARGSVTLGENEYECEGIDLLSFITTEELMIAGVQFDFSSSDIWGWRSPDSGKEVTLLTLDTGVVFIDSTDPENPCIMAKARSRRSPSPWGDIKVVGNTAYAIKDTSPVVGFDDSPATGMEVYDLEQFDDASMDCTVADYVVQDILPSFTGTEHGSCHNVVSNQETERVYSVGCRGTCDGGLVIFDVKGRKRLRPEMIGCVDQDGYTHDAQCVVYTGPDEKYRGREICLGFNEDTLTIWDVEDAANPFMISRTLYKNQAYSHQGWFNPEMTKVFLDDELDEECGLDPTTGICRALINEQEFEFEKSDGKTVTKVFNVEDLENPFQEDEIVHDTLSIDHNLYMWGAIHERGWGGNEKLNQVPSYDLMYLNNYMAGLQVINISDPTYPRTAFFDITEATEVEFFGSWSGYMHPSGVYAISSIERGIFFLDPREEFVTARQIEIPQPGPGGNNGNGDDSDPGSDPDSESESESGGASTALLVIFSFTVCGTLLAMYLLYQNTQRSKGVASNNAEAQAIDKATL